MKTANLNNHQFNKNTVQLPFYMSFYSLLHMNLSYTSQFHVISLFEPYHDGLIEINVILHLNIFKE